MSSSSDIDVQTDLPFPGDDLAFRVAGTSDRAWFFKSGRQSAEDIRAGLAVIGARPEACERILDFGCGCGRVLLWMKDLREKSALYGIDIDAAAIEWARPNLPYVTLAVNNPLPPTGFADGFFDLVYCHSVFTHIDETYQDAWLAELQRIVRTGGLLLLSVSGDHPFRELEKAWLAQGANPRTLRSSRDAKGLLYITDDDWTGGPFPDFYHTTFHTPAYVFAHWSRYFKIRAYIPQGSLAFQDYVLLERVNPQVLAQETSHLIADAVPNTGLAAYVQRQGGILRLARKALSRIRRRPSTSGREDARRHA